MESSPPLVERSAHSGITDVVGERRTTAKRPCRTESTIFDMAEECQRKGFDLSDVNAGVNCLRNFMQWLNRQSRRTSTGPLGVKWKEIRI